MSTASAIGAEDGRSAAKQAAATPGLIVPRSATPTLGRALLLHKSLKVKGGCHNKLDEKRLVRGRREQKLPSAYNLREVLR